MITASTPIGNTTVASIGLLSNQVGCSIALELVPGQVQQVGPSDVLFYDTIVNSDVLSAGYNLDTINTLIANDVLEYTDVVLTEPIPTVQTSGGGTFVGTISPNKSLQVLNREIQTTNHLDILPVTDSLGNLLIIYYRDAEGMSYSLNKGNTSVLISNVNLMYPDEITSYAVQVYNSPIALTPILKLFIGTLREGIKTFTPGIDSTYQDFVGIDSVVMPSDETALPGCREASQCTESIVVNPDTPGAIPVTVNGLTTYYATQQLYPDFIVDYLFQNSTSNIAPDVLPNTFKYISVAGITYSHINTGFAPVYILGILNFTLNNGCPLITYSRCLRDGKPDFKYCITPLHQQVYVTTTLNGRAKKTLTTTQSLWGTPLPNTVSVSRSGWTILQTDDGTTSHLINSLGQGLLPINILDVSGCTNGLTSAISGQLSSAIVSLRCYSTIVNGDVTEYLRFYSTETPLNQALGLSSFIYPPAPDTLRREPYITGTSIFIDPITGRETFFVTTDTAVWSYANSTWALLISSSASMATTLSTYFSTAITTSMQFASSLATMTTYLTGLRGFSIGSIPGSNTNFIAYMGSNIGIIQYKFICVSGVLSIKDTTTDSGRVLRQDLFNSYISDLTIPTGTNIVLSCAIQTSVPVRYDAQSNQMYYSYIPTDTLALPAPLTAKTTEYFDRSNYLVTDEPIQSFFSANTYKQFNYMPSDQIVALASETGNSIQVKTYLTNSITSSYYSAKFANYTVDSYLYLFLNRAFGKYIHLFIDQNVVNVVSASPYTYTLHGTSTYYTPIRAINELLTSEASAYFAANHIADGYIVND